jgi:hypothetical protein
MGAAEIFTFIGLCLKTFLVLFEKFNKTPVEKRLEAMSEYDAAISTAKEKKDLGDLSKWFGKRS